MEYRIIDHTADIGIEVEGTTMSEMLRRAAWAFADLITDAALLRPMETLELSVSGPNAEELLVRWLSELLFIFDTKGLLFGDIEIVACTDTWLTARVGGERFDPAKHPARREVKAVTYHGVCVDKTEGGCKGRVIFDI